MMASLSNAIIQCFNEAACNTGGTPRSPGLRAAPSHRFNEAACNTGGTRAAGPTGPGGGGSFNDAACNTGGTQLRCKAW